MVGARRFRFSGTGERRVGTTEIPQAEGTRGRVFYGWYVLAASFAILFFNAGVRFLIGVLMKPMLAEFGWSRSSISGAIFLNTAVYALSVIVVGRLYDKYGPKWVIVGSSVLFAAGYMLMAGVQSLWGLMLSYGVLAGAGFGGTTAPIFGAIISKWFERRRGLAVSLGMAGSCLGQFLLLPPFTSISTSVGWRATSFWLGAASLALNTLLTLVAIRSDPEAMGEVPFGSAQDGGGGLVSRSQAAAQSEGLTLREAMRTRSLWLFTIAMFVCGGGDFLITTHLVAVVTDYGIATSTAASMLAWFGLMSLAGILLAGPASDAIGDRRPIAITFALRVALFVMILLFRGEVPFWIFSLGFGLTFLVTAPLTPTLAGRLFGFANIGVISGFITTVHHVGGGLWAYLGGVIYDGTGGYSAAFAVSAGLAAVAVASTLLVREVRHQRGGGLGKTSPAAAGN